MWNQSRCKQPLQYLRYRTKVGDRSVAGWIVGVQALLLEYRRYLSQLAFCWEGALREREIRKMADHVREDIRAFLQNRCWNWVKWRRFARHGIDEFSHLLRCGWLDVAPLFFVMHLVETHRIRSSTSESLQYRDLDIPDLVVEEVCHLVAEAGILVRIRMVG